jgi:hypothetical protein
MQTRFVRSLLVIAALSISEGSLSFAKGDSPEAAEVERSAYGSGAG